MILACLSKSVTRAAKSGPRAFESGPRADQERLKSSPRSAMSGLTARGREEEGRKEGRKEGVDFNFKSNNSAPTGGE